MHLIYIRVSHRASGPHSHNHTVVSGYGLDLSFGSPAPFTASSRIGYGFVSLSWEWGGMG